MSWSRVRETRESIAAVQKKKNVASPKKEEKK
jgi:hypothetical protein